MANENRDLIEEWKVLRDEIARKQSFVERLVVTTVAGNLTIFSFAASLQGITPVNAFIALLPMLLTTISYFWILRNLYSGFRIAKYIREYIEPKTQLNWEAWMSLSRRKTQPEGRMKIRADVFAVYYHSLLVISLVVCIALIWVPKLSYGELTAGGGTGAPEVQPAPTEVYLVLTISAVMVWVIWYLVAKVLFIDYTKGSIGRFVKEMEDTEG